MIKVVALVLILSQLNVMLHVLDFSWVLRLGSADDEPVLDSTWARQLPRLPWPGVPIYQTGPPPEIGPSPQIRQEALHFVDVGAAFINTSFMSFVSSYPRGAEFTYHLIEPNPRVVERYHAELQQLGVPMSQVPLLQCQLGVHKRLHHTCRFARSG